MDKAEYQAKLEELTSYVRDRDYESALSIVNEIDWKRVKSVQTLSMVADVYEANRQYDDAKRILQISLERSPGSRTVLAHLTEVSIRLGEIQDAEDYYERFSKVAGNDNAQYLLHYKLLKAKRAPLEEQIAVLREYRELEYTEEWAFELASLYAKAGDEKRCVEECDDMILWFGTGKYVLRALELKMKYDGLTPAQRKLYNEEISRDSQTVTPQISEPYQVQKKTASAEPDDEQSEMKGKLRESFQEVFQGIRREPPREEAHVVKTDNTMPLEELHISELEPEHASVTVSEDEVSAETIVSVPDPKPEKKAEEQEPEEEKVWTDLGLARRKTEEEIAAEKVAQFDLDSLLAETAGAFSQEISSGAYEKTTDEDFLNHIPELETEEELAVMEDLPVKDISREAPELSGAAAEVLSAAETGLQSDLPAEPASVSPVEMTEKAEEPVPAELPHTEPEMPEELSDNMPDEFSGESVKGAQEAAEETVEEAGAADTDEEPEEAPESVVGGFIKRLFGRGPKAPEAVRQERSETADEKPDADDAPDVLPEQAAEAAAAEELISSGAAKAADKTAETQAKTDESTSEFTNTDAMEVDDIMVKESDEVVTTQKTAAQDQGTGTAPVKQRSAFAESIRLAVEAREAERKMHMAEEEKRRQEAERLAKEEAERQAKEDAERLAREARERVEREAAERQRREEEVRRARAEAERAAREAERLAQEEAERRAREEEERQAREEAERAEREEKERLAREEAERQAQEEAERLAKEEAERAAREEAERAAKAEAERAAREEAERAAKAEAERAAREEAERAAKAEAERAAREAEEIAAEEAADEAEEFTLDRDDLQAIKDEIDAEKDQEVQEAPVFEEVTPAEEAALAEAIAAFDQQNGTEAAEPSAVFSVTEITDAEEQPFEEEQPYEEVQSYEEVQPFEEEQAFAEEQPVIEEVPAEAEQSAPAQKKPLYNEELEVPDPEPTEKEKLSHSRTLDLSKVGENTVPVSLDEIISSETPEERRIRILHNEEQLRMNDEQRRIFTYFARIPGMDHQILSAMSAVYQHADEKTSAHGNLAIMGAQGSGKSKLAQNMISAMCLDLGMEAAKIARVTGYVLNKKDPAEIVRKMAGGFLIVEECSEMEDETVEKLGQAMDFRTDRMILILEDEKSAMRGFLRKHPEFSKRIEKVISIPIFTNDELISFARTYAEENGCRLDDMAVLALYTIIGNDQSYESPMTISKVKTMVDEAITQARKGPKRSRRGRRKGKEDNLLVIQEKDFETN